MEAVLDSWFRVVHLCLNRITYLWKWLWVLPCMKHTGKRKILALPFYDLLMIFKLAKSVVLFLICSSSSLTFPKWTTRQKIKIKTENLRQEDRFGFEGLLYFLDIISSSKKLKKQSQRMDGLRQAMWGFF